MRRIASAAAAAFTALIICLMLAGMELTAFAESGSRTFDEYSSYGGGYSASGQIPGVGYIAKLYDSSNGMPTSDAMFLLPAADGSIWLGGYSGVLRYDGSGFEKLDPSEGLTSARCFFQDSLGRIWVGTNDNGVVVINGTERRHLTYKDGLPSSSIRIFEEDGKGNVFIGTTAGVCYADKELTLHALPESEISEERVLKLDADKNGVIYGQTTNGIVFRIEDCEINGVCHSDELKTEKITTLMADHDNPGYVYLGTEDSSVYYGLFGEKKDRLKHIFAPELGGSVHWISRDCGRIWISSAGVLGYLDEDDRFRVIKNIPVNSGIEMTASDYQGNLWLASSTQGIMKIVTNNYVDMNGRAGLPGEVSNAVILHNDDLYIGTDNGLRIIGRNGNIKENRLTLAVGTSRVRCFAEDENGNLWTATYTNDTGLICFTPNEEIITYTVENGMPSDQIRSIDIGSDGHIYVGTNGGLAVIKDGKVINTAGIDEGINNTVILTVVEYEDGAVLAGTDGDGLYVISPDEIKRMGREDGLTSEVITRIIKDEAHGVYWLVTSNSIEYIKDGKITHVSSFPYNNNYDIAFDSKDNAWVMSSCGIYVVPAADLLGNKIKDHRLYTMANGLPYAITSNSYITKNDRGDLFIPGRNGVISVNIDNYYETKERILMNVRSIYCDDERIFPDENGVYRLPASRGRVQISASVMDYTMLDPTVRIYLEGGPDEGLTMQRSDLAELEYTNLPYGEYKLHLQVVDSSTGDVLQDSRFIIKKTARLHELLIVRIMLIVILVLLAGFIVWRIMRSTVIARQYDEIRNARDEAERANTAKSRFLANISHEIRTPINTIMGMNEMAMREDPTGVPNGYFMSMMNYAFDIRNASESLLGLINDLLDISKIESGRMHLVEQEYDVQEMIRSVVSMIRVRSTEKGLSFDVTVDEILPRRLFGDQVKIKQILLNLLSNAVKYTSIGGFILSVSMEERTGDTAKLRFSVKDTGMGIKEEDMDKLFTAYERLDEEINSTIQGTGLGLDISRRFAELMGGRIWCESVYREGSDFIFTVDQRIVDYTPLGVFAEQDESAVNGPYVPQFIAPDADILVVDDNPTNLNIMKGLLRATRVFVTTSVNGKDALEKIRDSHFDVVFSDLIMPVMDGIELIGKIREMDSELPVYALTANTTEDEEFYTSKGFNGFLSKPVDGELLERTIMRHLPDKMMEKPEKEDTEELKELPEELMWLNDTPGISVEDGIRNTGSVSGFLFALKLFLNTIDENEKMIREAYEKGNYKLFTIKVHAVKVSARIIGSAELAGLAGQVEEAGERRDMEYLAENTGSLLSEYKAYKEKLSGLAEKEN